MWINICMWKKHTSPGYNWTIRGCESVAETFQKTHIKCGNNSLNAHLLLGLLRLKFRLNQLSWLAFIIQRVILLTGWCKYRPAFFKLSSNCSAQPLSIAHRLLHSPTFTNARYASTFAFSNRLCKEHTRAHTHTLWLTQEHMVHHAQTHWQLERKAWAHDACAWSWTLAHFAEKQQWLHYFAEIIRELRSLGVCVCVCGSVRGCAHVCMYERLRVCVCQQHV